MLKHDGMFNKLRKLLAKDEIKTPEYQKIFNDVIGYDDIGGKTPEYQH